MPLMSVIAPRAAAAYSASMASAVLRLLALVALVFMPFSMASGPARAEPAASAPTGHCEEHQKPADAPSGAKMHCTGCAALPAMDAPAPVAELAPQLPMTLSLAKFIDGVEPETATPPPRLS
jgi:hypothetical protein